MCKNPGGSRHKGRKEKRGCARLQNKDKINSIGLNKNRNQYRQNNINLLRGGKKTCNGGGRAVGFCLCKAQNKLPLSPVNQLLCIILLVWLANVQLQEAILTNTFPNIRKPIPFLSILFKSPFCLIKNFF
ncbi:hypothetical protein TOT_020000104 [Theileria orientalis strain Shintoku]|uniref:Uncharacterized protein n=1 Tax=Theileria orientalis strain Shintoku TaxID=869250 RepID=J4C7Y2_THEOR|nr:hypothetical protein TOT_020000104 [Theileria orientalis strain Shintoku]PVC50198.1 hypothetical protein MACL_00002452 [Theileria orientalis]BAM39833.1 hypothetical protein TOT_020000104 [Theileria orientalis strain Shintoku]|eukprot:XP_009690134.1 hypothetical protein TOT_020000104 [Theileria orientalis strain Shintoku]